MAWVYLDKGQPEKLEVIYAETTCGQPQVQLIWAPVNNKPEPAAITAVKNADGVIAVAGITSRLESEESTVEQPGFFHGDRTNLKMPERQEALVRAVAATGKPLVVVLMNGGALGVDWEKAHVSAILQAWYRGKKATLPLLKRSAARTILPDVCPSRSTGMSTSCHFSRPFDARSHLTLF